MTPIWQKFIERIRISNRKRSEVEHSTQKRSESSKEENDDRLTYYQICSLAAQGLFGAIPEGYNIKWFNGVKPHKVIDEKIPGNSLTFVRNDFPQPDSISISGEYTVVVPTSWYDEETGAEPELMEYGDVYLKTEFSFTDFEFLYYNKDKQEEVRKHIERFVARFNDFRGYIKKSDFTFDAYINIDIEKMEFFGVQMNNGSYPSLEYEDGTIYEDEPTRVSFVYDHYAFVPISTEK